MPIHDFYGDTFVAYIDISGFKELMKQNKAIISMNKFYSYGYYALQDQINNDLRIEGIFVSDCGILFVNTQQNDITNKLRELLKVVKKINKSMLIDNYMLTTSIAYGEFSYHEKLEFPGIEKNPIYGGAYVKAFLDNENGYPKIQPGQCRIIIDEFLKNQINLNIENNDILKMVVPIPGDKKHYRFYWNLEDSEQILGFEEKYKDAYNTKYAGMLKALKAD